MSTRVYTQTQLKFIALFLGIPLWQVWFRLYYAVMSLTNNGAVMIKNFIRGNLASWERTVGQNHDLAGQNSKKWFFDFWLLFALNLSEIGQGRLI